MLVNIIHIKALKRKVFTFLEKVYDIASSRFMFRDMKVVADLPNVSLDFFQNIVTFELVKCTRKRWTVNMSKSELQTIN